MNAPNELSFLPDDYLERKAQRRTNTICAVLFLIVVVAIGAAFTFSERKLRAEERRNSDVNQRYADAAKRIEQVKRMFDKQRQMDHQAELTASLLEKIPRSNLMAELTNKLPASTSLLEFTMESKKKAVPVVAKTIYEKKKAEAEKDAQAAREGKKNGTGLPDPPSYDVVLKIIGISDNDAQVAQYIHNLGTSELLKDVNLMVTEAFERKEQKLRKYQIEAMLNPTARVMPSTRPSNTAVRELKR